MQADFSATNIELLDVQEMLRTVAWKKMNWDEDYKNVRAKSRCENHKIR